MQALIVIDVQSEYTADGALPVERFDATLQSIESLLKAARSDKDTKVVHVRHVSRSVGDGSFDAGTKGVGIVAEAAPLDGEFVLTKHYPGAFTNPDLDRYLLRNGVSRLFICGLTSILCCDTTAREAFQLGYEVFYVEDAISEFPLGELSAETLHKAVNAIQGIMFSTVVSTEEAIRRIGS
jgi:nicotinamidase-related amidase